jgi:hypothetical protein
VKDRLGDVLLSTITRETIEGFQAKRKLDGVRNRTVNMDVGGPAQGPDALRPLAPAAGPCHDVEQGCGTPISAGRTHDSVDPRRPSR